MYRFYSKKISVFVLLASLMLWAVPVRAIDDSHGIDIAGMDRSVNSR